MSKVFVNTSLSLRIFFDLLSPWLYIDDRIPFIRSGGSEGEEHMSEKVGVADMITSEKMKLPMQLLQQMVWTMSKVLSILWPGSTLEMWHSCLFTIPMRLSNANFANSSDV